MINMINNWNTFQCPYYNPSNNDVYRTYNHPYFAIKPFYTQCIWNQLPAQYFTCTDKHKASNRIILKDYGPGPFAVDIEEAAEQNNNFRIALWTGRHLQVTLMSINVGNDIGLEIHPQLDQFIRIEEGQGLVKMGDRMNAMNFQAIVLDGDAFIIPAGKWHNLINTGNKPLKLYSIYAPPQHPYGTVHATKADAIAAEGNH